MTALVENNTKNYQFEEDGYDVVDHDDYEYMQFLSEDRMPTRVHEKDENIAFVTQLTGYSEPYRFENWPLDDLIAYVGGNYAKEEYSK